VFSTYVIAAAPANRGDSEGAAACEKTSLSEVLAQRGLHYRGKRWRRFLGLAIAVNGFGQIVWKGHRGSFHRASIAPIGEVGALSHL
jgi:hypothetical protein